MILGYMLAVYTRERSTIYGHKITLKIQNLRICHWGEITKKSNPGFNRTLGDKNQTNPKENISKGSEARVNGIS
jgi:hypothetical protein